MIGQMAKDLGVTTRFVAAFAQGHLMRIKLMRSARKMGALEQSTIRQSN
jgi:hypothetical protein